MRSDVTARTYHWVPINKREALFGFRKNKQQPSVKRTQFSLTLSCAFKFHKVQGLRLPEGVISFDLESQKSFNQGQMYVALSKFTSITELYLIGKCHKAALKVNESAMRDYERLRTENCSKSQTQDKVTESAITISLLNTCSGHFEGKTLDNNMLCLTETQLEMNDYTYMMESTLARQFKIHFYSNINNFKSIAYGYSREISILSHEYFNVISIFTLKKQQFSYTPISITLIYTSLKSPLSEFIDSLQYLVGRNIDTFLGDC